LDITEASFEVFDDIRGSEDVVSIRTHGIFRECIHGKLSHLREGWPGSRFNIIQRGDEEYEREKVRGGAWTSLQIWHRGGRARALEVVPPLFLGITIGEGTIGGPR